MGHLDTHDLSGDVDQLPEETRQLARLAVCANATDADDAGELLAMLGLVEGARRSTRYRGLGGRVMVPAGPARKRLKELVKLGATWPELVLATGFSSPSLRAIHEGQVRSIRQDAAQTILAVTGIGKAVPA